MHECKLCKSDKMQDCLIGDNEIFYCRSCGRELDDSDVHKSLIKKYKR